jgi:hypothetical protein
LDIEMDVLAPATALALLLAAAPLPAASAAATASPAVAVVAEPSDISADAQPQTPAEQKEPPTPPHTGVRALASGLIEDVKHLPSPPNAYLAAIGGGLAASVHPLDDTVNIKLRGHQAAARPIFAPGKYVGQTAVQVGAALLVYTVGRVDDRPKVSHLGMDLLRAQILVAGLTTGLKYATHRERPDGSNAQSFPSGHASITFATATVIERHLGWRSSALGYSVASYVAASRLHDNRHWLSDVVFGAAVGAISGRTVTQHGRNFWTMMPVPVPGGVAIVAMKSGEEGR